jgi:hypothetical protein
MTRMSYSIYLDTGNRIGTYEGRIREQEARRQIQCDEVRRVRLSDRLSDTRFSDSHQVLNVEQTAQKSLNLCRH